jgi:hypothetical protein
VALSDAWGKRLQIGTLPDRAYATDIDGTLGVNYLYDFDVDLDLPGGRLGLYKAAGGCGRPHAALPPRLNSVPTGRLTGLLALPWK